MGTWTLWIAFNSSVAVFLLFDLCLFHRRAHEVSIREAVLESAAWVALSFGFGFWILFSYGNGPGLEFFTGYLVEKSLSIDNILVFILIFQYFRVDSRYQHRLLFWGVLGALVLRGVMIGVGVVLIERFEWILYLFGAFLLYAGFRLFRAERGVNPGQNSTVHWIQKTLPTTHGDTGQKLFLREDGRWLATPLFLVIIVLEITDLVFAMDSIPAVFGVTHDPFLVYTSNVCAILGLRAFYFLLAGALPYFRYLHEGLAVVLIFIGAKMLAEPWVHLSTGVSLAIVGGVIAAAVMISIIARRSHDDNRESLEHRDPLEEVPLMAQDYILRLAGEKARQRVQAAQYLFSDGTARISGWIDELRNDEEFQGLLVQEHFERPHEDGIPLPRLTVGIAVLPDAFDKIRAANGSPPLADAPADQDVLEFELEFAGDFPQLFRLDILTSNAPGGDGAMARFLRKFGAGIQQVEIDVTDVDRATEILRTRFKIEPIYPATRHGANGTCVNFFLVNAGDGKKVLAELVEQPKTAA